LLNFLDSIIVYLNNELMIGVICDYKSVIIVV